MDQNTRGQGAGSRRARVALVGAISVAAAGTALVAAATHGPPADDGRTLAAVGAIATVSAVPPPGASAPSSGAASSSPPAGAPVARSSQSAAPSASSATSPTSAPEAPNQTPQVKRRAEWGEPVVGADAEAAIRLVADYLAAADRAYAGVGAAAVGNDRIAIGPARGEIEAAVAELEHEGRHQDGAVSIAAASVFTQKQKHRLLVVACVDSSAVRVVEGDRTAVRAAAPSGTRRDLHEFLLQRTGDRWVVHTHAMPIDTSCGR